MPNKKKRNVKEYKPRNKKTEFSEKEYMSSRCPGNDFAWYNKNPQLLTSAGSLIFSRRYGDLYKSLSYAGSNYTINNSGNRSVAGVMRAVYYPFVAAEGTEADPINIAAKNIYTWLRHKNSGAKVFEQSDVIQVLLSSGSVKAALEFAKKLLRCVASYSAVNRFAMRHIIPYTDAEFTNMVSNLANYTARLNMLIAKATSIIIPKDIPLFSRWKWLSANVFKDDQLQKCSYYTFQPEVLWHYDWANHKCTTSSLLTSTFASLLSAIETEINNLLSYDDYGTISGDILKAYGEGNIDVTTGMNLGEIQDPTYDMDAVNQFKNMVVAQHTYDYEIDQVSANSQLLHTVCTTSAVQTALPGKFVYDGSSDSPVDAGFTYLPKLVVSSDHPTVEECVEQTRLSYVIKTADVNGDIRYYLPEVGTEVITGLKAMYFADWNYSTVQATRDLETVQFVDYTSPDLYDNIIKQYVVSASIKGHPQFIVITYDSSDIDATQYFEGENITVLDEQYIATLHKACVLSEWTMPMFSFLEVK